MSGFAEGFDKLSMADREKFRQMVNYLLAHSFLISRRFDFENNTRPVSSDYIFVEKNLDLFQDYCSYAGFTLTVDTNFGVIALDSSYEGNRVRFDKLTTLMIYCLRLMYDEKRAEVSLSDVVFVTTSEIIGKLTTTGAISKKPSDQRMADALRQLVRFNLLQKKEGDYEDAATVYVILPTILFIISNEQISNINRLVDETVKDENAQEDQEALEEEQAIEMEKED